MGKHWSKHFLTVLSIITLMTSFLGHERIFAQGSGGTPYSVSVTADATKKILSYKIEFLQPVLTHDTKITIALPPLIEVQAGAQYIRGTISTNISLGGTCNATTDSCSVSYTRMEADGIQTGDKMTFTAKMKGMSIERGETTDILPSSAFDISEGSGEMKDGIYFSQIITQNTGINGGNNVLSGPVGGISILYVPPLGSPFSSDIYKQTIGVQTMEMLNFISGGSATSSGGGGTGGSGGNAFISTGGTGATTTSTCPPSCGGQEDEIGFYDITEGDRMMPGTPESLNPNWYDIEGPLIGVRFDLPQDTYNAILANTATFYFGWQRDNVQTVSPSTHISSTPSSMESFECRNLSNKYSCYTVVQNPSNPQNGKWIFRRWVYTGSPGNWNSSGSAIDWIINIDNFKPTATVTGDLSTTWRNTGTIVSTTFTDSVGGNNTTRSGLKPYSSIEAVEYFHKTVSNETTSADYNSHINATINPANYNTPAIHILDGGSLDSNLYMDQIIMNDRVVSEEGVNILYAKVHDTAYRNSTHNPDTYHFANKIGNFTSTDDKIVMLGIVAIDRTKPTVSGSKSLAGLADDSVKTGWIRGAAGSENKHICYNVKGKDSMSGIASVSLNSNPSPGGGTCQAPTPGTDEFVKSYYLDQEGPYEVSAASVDVAGNTSAIFEETFKVDWRSPEFITFPLVSSEQSAPTLTEIANNRGNLGTITALDTMAHGMAVEIPTSGSLTNPILEKSKKQYLDPKEWYITKPENLFFEIGGKDADPLDKKGIGTGTEGVHYSGNIQYRFYLESMDHPQFEFLSKKTDKPDRIKPSVCAITGTSPNCWTEWKNQSDFESSGQGTYFVPYNSFHSFTCTNDGGVVISSSCSGPDLQENHHYILWVEMRDAAHNSTTTAFGAMYNYGYDMSYYTNYSTDKYKSPISSGIDTDNTRDRFTNYTFSGANGWTNDASKKHMTTWYAKPIVTGENVKFETLYAIPNNIYNAEEFIRTSIDPNEQKTYIDKNGNTATKKLSEIYHMLFTGEEHKVRGVNAAQFSVMNINTEAFHESHWRNGVNHPNFSDLQALRDAVNGGSTSSSAPVMPFVYIRNGKQIIYQDGEEKIKDKGMMPSSGIFQKFPNLNFSLLSDCELLVREDTGRTYFPTTPGCNKPSLSGKWYPETKWSANNGVFSNFGLRKELILPGPGSNFNVVKANPQTFNTSTAGVYDVYLGVRFTGDKIYYIRILFEVIPGRPDLDKCDASKPEDTCSKLKLGV